MKNWTLLLWYLKFTCFRSFLGKIEDTKRDISKLTDLYLQQVGKEYSTEKKTIGIFIIQIYAYGMVHLKLLKTFIWRIWWKVEIQKDPGNDSKFKYNLQKKHWKKTCNLSTPN